MLLLEEPDSVVSNWRKSIVWRLTVGSLEGGLGRLIDSGGGDEGQCFAPISQNRDGIFLSTMIALVILRGDITDTFFHRSVRMVFALGYNDMLNVISKQKVVKLVEICEQYLGVTVNTRDELDICLLSSCLVPMRDK